MNWGSWKTITLPETWARKRSIQSRVWWYRQIKKGKIFDNFFGVWSACVFVHVCIHVHFFVFLAPTCWCMWLQEVNGLWLRTFLYHPAPYFWDRVSQWSQSSLIWKDSLACKFWKPSSLQWWRLQAPGATSVFHFVFVCLQVLGIWTQLFILWKQALYWCPCSSCRNFSS